MRGHEILNDRYRLLDRLHRGRNTDVWVGEHIQLKKKFAVKILFPHEIPAADERLRAMKRFSQEAITHARLDHPSIVQVYDFGKADGWLYFVMEYAPYGSVARYHLLGEQLPLATVRIYTSQVGRAIHYLHNRGLIHRDIKPGNMFLKTRNRVLLGDMGLVIHDRGSYSPRLFWEFGGTRAYMAPEQEQGKPCQASDQYAFATIIFEWLTGRSPFDGTDIEIAWQRRNLHPPSMRAIVPEIPAAVEQVVLTALQRAPNDRFKSILDFTLAFEEACQPVTVRLPYDASRSRSSRRTRFYKHGSTPGYKSVARQQHAVGYTRQPVFAGRGNALVTSHSHPVLSRQRQLEEEPWNPVPTSRVWEINTAQAQFDPAQGRVSNALQRLVTLLRG